MRELIFAEAEPNLTFANRGEDVLIMTPGGEVFTFNALQADILRALDGKTELGEVARRCGEKYGQEMGASELREFLRDAQEIGLLSLRTAGPSAASAQVVEKGARQLERELRAAGLPPPGLPTPWADFADRVLERLGAGDARGAAAAVAALRSIAPEKEWIRYLETEVQGLLRPRSKVTFGLGRVTIPLFNPDRLLAKLDRRLGWLFSGWGVALWAALVLAGLYLSPPVAMLAVRDYLQGGVIVVMYLCLVLSITLHEFSHALTCHHYGGRVTEMGVGWLFIGPMAFADVTSSYLFEKKRQRVLVMVAGTLGSILSIALATLIWRLIPKGGPIDLGLRAFLFAGWVEVFFNLVPFRKTDGYFILADLLDIENLNRRAATLVRTVFGRLFAGEAVAPSDEPPQAKRRLLFYWALDALYLALIYLVLIPVSYDQTPPDARRLFVLMITFGVVMLIWPLVKGVGEVLRFAMQHRREILNPGRLWRWGLPTALLLVVFVLPWLHETARATFALRPIERVELRSEVGGEVATVSVQAGDEVAAGQLVAVLRNPDLELKQKLAEAELAEAQIELARIAGGARPEEQQVAKSAVALSSAELQKAAELERREPEREAQGLLTADTVAAAQGAVAEAAEASRVASSSLDLLRAGSRKEDLASARARTEAARERLAAVNTELARLELRSPIAGRIEDLDLAANVGRWLQPGETFTRVVDGSRFLGQLSPSWLLSPDRVIGGTVKLFLPDGRTLRGTVARTLLQSADTQQHGVTLETSPLGGAGLAEGLTGRAVIYGPREPLVTQLIWHPLLRFLEVVLWAAL